jgi:hypothetical protein
MITGTGNRVDGNRRQPYSRRRKAATPRKIQLTGINMPLNQVRWYQCRSSQCIRSSVRQSAVSVPLKNYLDRIHTMYKH